MRGMQSLCSVFARSTTYSSQKRENVRSEQHVVAPGNPHEMVPLYAPAPQHAVPKSRLSPERHVKREMRRIESFEERCKHCWVKLTNFSYRLLDNEPHVFWLHKFIRISVIDISCIKATLLSQSTTVEAEKYRFSPYDAVLAITCRVKPYDE